MTTTIHPFESAGLGLAPFRFVGLSEKVYVACPGATAKPAGTCDYCSTGIKYCCHIRSHDGKSFIVGTDCVRKIGREDNRLLTAVEREVAKLEKAKRDAKRQAKWEKVRAEREAALQTQRERNGGLTDAEVADQQRKAAEAAKAAEMQEQNAWLLNVLERVPYESGFVDSMKESLTRNLACNLSDRCLAILAEIYAKVVSGGKKRGKEVEAAIDQFWEKVQTTEVAR